MSKSFLKLLFLSLVIMLLLADQGFAQRQTGAIRGMVKDEQGEPLPGAAIELKGVALMGVRTTTSEADGGFRFMNLPVGGDYELTFTLQGFQTLTSKNHRVSIGGTIVLDIILKPATLATEVTVLATSPLVDVEKSSFSSTFNSQTLDTLPTRRYTFFEN